MIESPVFFNGFVFNGPSRSPVQSFTGTTFNVPRHGLVLNQKVSFSVDQSTGGTLPSGLTAGQVYYVVVVGDNDHFDVSATLGGSAITPSGGTGQLYVNVADAYNQLTNVDGLWDSDVRTEVIDLPGRSGSRSSDFFYSGKTVVLTGTIYAKAIWDMNNHMLAMHAATDDMLFYPLQFALFTGPATKTDLYMNCRKNQRSTIPIALPQSSGGGFPFRGSYVIQFFADDPTVYEVGTDASYVIF